MPRFSLRSLRAKLQIFSLALVIVPGVLFALIALARARDALEHAVGQQLGEVAHETLNELAAALAGERDDVRAWARQDVMRDVVIGDLDKRASRFLRSLVDGGAPFLELLCIDRDGRVVAATDPRSLGQMLGERDWARTALRGEEFLSGPIPASDHVAAAMEIAAPIRLPETGTVIGAVLGLYDWQHVIALATRIRRTLAPHGLRVDVLLLDRSGTVIGESWREDVDGQAAEELRAAGARIVQRFATSPRRGYVSEAQAGALVGFAGTDDPKLGWATLVIEPLAAAFAPVRDMERRLAVALAGVLLAALAVATFLARRMSRPLRALTLATQEVAHGGEPRRPVEVRSRDEIGQLAAAFNTMTAELKCAQDDLLTASKFAFVGEVAAGVAHEVRTPLGILRSSAQILARSVPAADPEGAELVQMIIEEVDRLDRVVGGLLELARPREPLVEPTPLAPLLARALDFAEGQAREKNISIERVLAADSSPARCDPEQIYQVALNLIVNALQMVPGGGRITVRTLPRHDGHVGFEVIDDGPGIPPDVREHVFTPFFTLREGGTGLGLALVQRVVRAHHGTVSVDSTVGGGATFRVVLPAA